MSEAAPAGRRGLDSKIGFVAAATGRTFLGSPRKVPKEGDSRGFASLRIPDVSFCFPSDDTGFGPILMLFVGAPVFCGYPLVLTVYSAAAPLPGSGTIATLPDRRRFAVNRQNDRTAAPQQVLESPENKTSVSRFASYTGAGSV